MTQYIGDVPEEGLGGADAQPALVSDQAATRLDPTGFDQAQLSVLKPCPFCGDRTGPHAEHVSGDIWGVHCPNGQCPTFGCWVVQGFSEDEAINLWNTRAAPSACDATEVSERLLHWRDSLTLRSEEFREALLRAAQILARMPDSADAQNGEAA